MSSLLIRDAQLVTATELLKVDVLVQHGMITKLAYHNSPTYALPSVPDDPIQEVIEAEGLLLFPSLIDCHVHFREPGLTHKATMASEAAAARAGGVGTVCEMPNTNPPTVTVAALADKVRRAAEVKACDIRFFFGITQTDHLMTLEHLWLASSEELQRLKARCSGVKIYLDHSTGDQKIRDEVLSEVFRVAAAENIPIVAHCEDPAINAEAAGKNTRTDVAVHSLLRPPEAEIVAIEHAIGLARKFGAPLHIAHLSTKGGLDLVRSAKKEGLRITCEVAPHHLLLTTADYDRLGTLAKMNPPLRTPEHVDALWEGLKDGTVDCVSTDHAPHTLEEKNAAEPLKAPSGVPGVETMLPLLLTAASEKRIAYPDIVRLCFENPNKIFQLCKQGIAEGAPAELILVDPKAQWTIKAENLHSLCGWTPFEGMLVRGMVMRNFVPIN